MDLALTVVSVLVWFEYHLSTEQLSPSVSDPSTRTPLLACRCRQYTPDFPELHEAHHHAMLPKRSLPNQLAVSPSALCTTIHGMPNAPCAFTNSFVRQTFLISRIDAPLH